ncbi:MAG: phosphodiesterase, family [Frankiales bacterium]|nr:phosphodiesterase, family [Frankiales bacterium]
MLIGLISDTHVPEAGAELAPAVLDALAGCERILHGGDLHSISVVDRLEQIAPTVVSRGNGDTLMPLANRPGIPVDPRVLDDVLIEVGGLTIGMTHDLERLEGRSDADAADVLLRVFGRRVDIAVCGHSHVPMIWGLADGTAIVNPGSAMLPYGYMGLIGTLGYLDIEDGRFVATVIDVESREVQLRIEGPAQQAAKYGPRPTGGR